MKIIYRYLAAVIGLLVPILAWGHEGDFRPIEFVKNEGQWDGPFVYKAQYGNITLFLENNTFTYVVGAADNAKKIFDYKHLKTKEKPVLYHHAYKVHMLHANPNPEISGSKPQPYYHNYYLGNDTSRWKSFIYPNLVVDYKNVYNGIDLHVASEGQDIKYDFIVHTGANADNIQLQFEGADALDIRNGNLVITTSVGTIQEMAPYAYQYIDGERKEVPCKYKLQDNVLTYHFTKGYDKNYTLIIDPQIVFTTFTGSTDDNWGFTATYDNQGNFYAGGIVGGAVGGGSTGYPRTVGPSSHSGGNDADSNASAIPSDMGITKFNPTGTTNVYSTYLGGLSQDQPHSMVVDGQGNLYIAGRTYSPDFPIQGTGSAHNGRSDIIVVKLNPNGTLNASRFVGGSADDGVNISSAYGNIRSLKHTYADDARSEVLLDNAGNVYVASSTKSGNFPMANPTKNTLTGVQDGVVFKLNNALTTLLWSTYVGGNSEDAAYVLALNKSESSVYVSGGTTSADFAGNGGLWNSYQGGSADGFIQKYANGGSYGLQRATLIGRGGYDQCFGIQVDDENNVYVMGNTLGGTFPVTAGVYNNPGSSQFVMKLDSNISTNIYSTVYGSGTSSVTNITPVAFLVDTCQNVYISGWGGAVAGNGGNTNGMPATFGASQPTPSGIVSTTTNGDDFYFIVFSKNAASLLFAAFYGGSTLGEHVDGGTSRFDRNGVVYQAICGGCGGSSAVPMTPNVFRNTNGSSNCNLLALKIAFNLGSVDANLTVQPAASVCLGEPFNFSSNGSTNATNFQWDFGDGNSTTTPNPTHTYATGGTFNVRLIALNPNACKISDTAFVTVRVDTNSINADFDVVQTDSCKPFKATFTNKSKAGGSTTHTWLFGDGKSFNGPNPPAHEYPDTGTYTITLILNDPAACNPNDTIQKTISFNTLYVEAKFEGPPVVCEKTGAQFNNRSENALTFLWKFGDGRTSSESNPKHVYDTAGTYIITMYAYNPGTCNGVDSLTDTIQVESTPIANFRHDPIIPVTNEPIKFTNLSQRATSWVWDFGDNTFTTLETPEPKFYRRTGSYRVCLQALNKVGCADTICKYVDADVYPLADLPKAFSPNGDGENDILYVRGAGIETIDLKIYNRWGELVFESADVKIGWDGKYKGAEAPVEAYGYVLNVTFVDGTTFNKKGNVTLLR
ncbi:MAG: PKD domain-containing protein [Taibaiella sp.]|nr:PKD domain-containing protein [Taibaiella sp.]